MALGKYRRAVWNDMRAIDGNAAKKFKDARWSLMKNRDKLTDHVDHAMGPLGPCTERLRFPGSDESVESVPVGSLHRSYHPLGFVDHESNELGCDLLGIQEQRRV